MCHSEIPETWERIQADGTEIPITVPSGEEMPALYLGAEGAPGVLLIADMFGRSAFYEQLAARVAAEGLQVLLPEYFFRQGPLIGSGYEAGFARRAQLDEAQSVEDMRALASWLRQRSDGASVGVLGFCMGGTFALDLASTEDDLVTVAYYGFPVPQASIPRPPARPIDLVDSLRGPVLAFWGDADEFVGMDNVRAYVERATAANAEFRSEVLPGLGHGFLGAADLPDPSDMGTVSWQQALSHLRSNLLDRTRS
jgi:carboxymethylenebutenolidase